MITTFSDYITPSAVERAKQKFAGATAKAFFNAAKAHDSDAINLLFYEGKDVIAQAFFKYYLGPDKKSWRARIYDGDDREFAAEVYAMLLGSGLKTNPLDTFDYSKFSNQTLPFAINKFKYYLLRYSEALAFIMLRQKKAGGLSGNLPKDANPQFISKDADIGEGKSAEGSLAALGVEDSGYTDMEMSMEVRQFLTFIKKNNPDLYDVAIMGARGLSPKEISAKLDISPYHVQKKQQALKGEYMKNFVESKRVQEGVGDQPFEVENKQAPLELYDGTFSLADLWITLEDMLAEGADVGLGLDILKEVIDADAGGLDPYATLEQKSREFASDFYGEDVFIEETNKEALKKSVVKYLESLEGFIGGL